jgi:GTPase KRas protein
VVNRSTIEEITAMRNQVGRVKEGDGMAEVPIVLVGNKIDLEGSREVSTEEGTELAKKLGCPFVEASAKARINVDEGFLQVVREIRRISAKKAGGQAGPGAKKKKGGKAAGKGAGAKKKGCLLF